MKIKNFKNIQQYLSEKVKIKQKKIFILTNNEECNNTSLNKYAWIETVSLTHIPEEVTKILVLGKKCFYLLFNMNGMNLKTKYKEILFKTNHKIKPWHWKQKLNKIQNNIYEKLANDQTIWYK